MKDGFIKVCTSSPSIKVGDVPYNAEQIIDAIRSAEKHGARVAVFPELCLTGSTAGDLYFHNCLIASAADYILKIAKATGDIIAVVGMPVACGSKLYNAAAILKSGEILAFVPNTCPENKRVFAQGEADATVTIGKKQLPLSSNLLVRDTCGLVLGIEFGNDLNAPVSQSVSLSNAGANVIACLRSSIDYLGGDSLTESSVKAISKRLSVGYLLANCGEGESTTDSVYGGVSLISENGEIVARGTNTVYSELDLQRINFARIKNNDRNEHGNALFNIYTELKACETSLSRPISRSPWIFSDMTKILELQGVGLKKRLLHTGTKTAVIGISGGLDSTLALLATCRAFDMLGLDRKGILAITMPCFGTTDRTYQNAVKLINALGATFMEIDIKNSVTAHFRDIGQDPTVTDVTYENAQARERTQVLMDIANKNCGLVIGTGDLSELALGWATYNGDHMSMYGVNAGIPKTAIRVLLEQTADSLPNELKAILTDILNTPVSPELLPAKEGEIAQKTESIVGPYILHDFFIWHILSSSASPSKLLRLAEYAFEGEFSREEIIKWERVFFRRFFNQQFKRSCLPDGVQVYEYSLSPRGSFQMPSDASWSVWEKELETLEKR